VIAHYKKGNRTGNYHFSGENNGNNGLVHAWTPLFWVNIENHFLSITKKSAQFFRFYYILYMRITFVLLFLLAAYASAQSKTLALGVFGEEGAKFKALKPLKQKFESTLSKEGKFKVTDRSAAILKLLRNDYEYDAGTLVADDDARQIGELFKAQYLCVVESSNNGSGHFMLNATLVNVEEEDEPSVAANVQSRLSNQQDVNRAADELVSQLLKRTGGIYIDSRYKMNSLSQEFAKVLKKRVAFKDGPCSANSMVVQINTSEGGCEGQNAISCSINVSLEGTGCTNEAELHLRGTVRATDKTEKAAMDVAKRELLNGKPDFIRDWVEELKPWTGKK
jgi:hypothetical protein